MKNVKIFRRDEYINNWIPLAVYVNNKKYMLPTNSSIDLKLENTPTEIYVRHLWVKTKKLIIDDTYGDNLELQVKPCLSDKTLFIFFGSVVIFYLLSTIFNVSFLEYIFKILGISFVLVMFYFITLGSRNYFKMEIKSTQVSQV